MKTTYLVVSPGYWAVDEDLKFAVTYLLSMGARNGTKDLKVEVFNVTEDWERDGFSVKATKVERLPDIMVKPALIEKVWSAIDKIEDLTDAALIEHDRKTDEAAA